MRDVVSNLICIALAVGAITGCAGTPEAAEAPASSPAPAPAVDAPLADGTCPTCGRSPELVPFEWDETVPGSEPSPIIFIPGGDFTPDGPPPVALPADEALLKARVDGRYRTLLRKIEAPDDYLYYGEFTDYGRWGGTAWAGHDDLPPGDWVYVYPHWYIWESVRRSSPHRR